MQRLGEIELFPDSQNEEVKVVLSFVSLELFHSLLEVDVMVVLSVTDVQHCGRLRPEGGHILLELLEALDDIGIQTSEMA